MRPQKVPSLIVPPVHSTIQGKLFAQLLDILNYLMGHLNFGKWNPYSFSCLIDINIF